MLFVFFWRHLSHKHTHIELGRAGRDGKPSIAIIFWHSGQKLKKCMRTFLKSENLCLRMIIARHFDPECSPADIYDLQPGDTDAQKAENCCIVCRERGTMKDTDTMPQTVLVARETYALRFALSVAKRTPTLNIKLINTCFGSAGSSLVVRSNPFFFNYYSIKCNMSIK